MSIKQANRGYLQPNTSLTSVLLDNVVPYPLHDAAGPSNVMTHALQSINLV